MSPAPAASHSNRTRKRSSQVRSRAAESGSGTRHHRNVEPPTISYRIFKGVLHALKEHSDQPRELDARLSNCRMHSLNRAELIKTFQFLGLADGRLLVTRQLTDLLQALDTPAWPLALRLILTDAYAGLLKGPVETLSGNALLRSFRTICAAHADNTRKSAEFFIHAARDATMETGYVPVSAARLRFPAPQLDTIDLCTSALLPGDLTIEIVKTLVSKFPAFDHDWADETKSLWLTAYVELAQRLPAAD